MRTFILALKSMRCQRFSLAIILVQLSVCFAILVYTASAFFGQFNILITANGTQNGYLYLSPDSLYIENYSMNYQGKQSSEIYEEFLKEQGLSLDSQLTAEQSKASYIYMLERNNEEFDKYHYKGKYLFSDLYDMLSQTGLISDTISNAGCTTSYVDENGNNSSYFSMITLMDKKLYNGMKLDTVYGKNLMTYEAKENYFYAVMYPNVSVDGEVYELPYSVGDVLTQEVYNIETHKTEQFRFEIVDKLKDPAYVMPQLFYSGDGSSEIKLESAFLSVQSMKYNGSLIALKPDDFSTEAYYSKYSETFTLIKPREDLSADEYSQLIETIRDCGFNVINLDEATENTLNNIWSFICENCLILAISVIMVVFSVISVSMLSGSQLRCEYAIYRLCGANNGKIKGIVAVKWAFIFVPSIISGIIISIIYSMISGASIRFIWVSAFVSVTMFVLLYLVSFILSYKCANTGCSSTDCCASR